MTTALFILAYWMVGVGIGIRDYRKVTDITLARLASIVTVEAAAWPIILFMTFLERIPNPVIIRKKP